MGSSKGNESNRRRGAKGQRAGRDILGMEKLENRTLLTSVPILWHPTTTNLADAQNGPMANAGTTLIGVYEAFTKGGATTAQLQSSNPLLIFQGSSVNVSVNWNGSGNFTDYQNYLKNLGMQTQAVSATYGIVSGWLPINQLPTVAQMPQTMSLHQNEIPVTRYQGIANNEAQQSLQANTAATQFGLTGAGVTVGVLSDSVSQYAGGLADSYKTGDLSASNPVNVLQDGNANTGQTDEGRAMLENIHDIAPGANLAFATAGTSDLQMAQNIQALQSQANAQIIVDDIGFFDEPFFQNGVISQAINSVVASGATYFSAAGNSANSGYLSQFRQTTASLAGVTNGTFMNFAPTGTPVTQLPITTGGPNVTLTFQFDQPFATQQPVGSSGVVTSQMNFYILNSTGAVVASGTNNNLATQSPMQTVTIPSAGSYTVAIQLVSGPAPQHVEFVQVTEQPMTVSQEFGAAGSTTYPSTYGHPTDTNAIGVGATPWWAPSPYLNQQPLASEPFSAYGPVLKVFHADGTPLTTPQVVLQPTLTAPDGGNTSFFTPGQIIDTSNPPFPGEPATTTNLSQNLPSFFGTSSAAPNAAAVAALMKQFQPGLTPTLIKQGLLASVEPMNGAAQGTWDQQAGYGLINAVKALNAVDQLHVTTATPGNAQTVTSTPSQIVVTFSKPVNFSTVTASDITFTGMPAGVTVQIGTPTAVDTATNPTQVAFPFSFTFPTGTTANGAYAYTIGGSVMSADGKPLVPQTETFSLADTTSPTITGTTVKGRVITIQLSKPIDPATVGLGTFELLRKNGAAYFGAPGTIDVNLYPGTTIAYNPTNLTVTLDFSALPQTDLPTDDYAIVVADTVTDLVGNPLDGVFDGVFPSGNGHPPSTFLEDLGTQTLQAPQVVSLALAQTSLTGVQNAQLTDQTQPTFVGVVSAGFPGTVAGLTVYIEFNALHNGQFDLNVGPGGRGLTGNYDVTAVTNADGSFTFTSPVPLPDGLNQIRALVVGEQDIATPPGGTATPGLSSTLDRSFRVDTTAPQIIAASLTPGGLPLTSGTNLSSLSSISLDVLDPVNPQDPNSPLAVPVQLAFNALDPTTADNISNYSLINQADGSNASAFIATANFVPTAQDFVSPPDRTAPNQPYTGRVDLTFFAGLPAGVYTLIAHTQEGVYSGLRDSAGNPLNNTTVTGTADFQLTVNVQSTPAYMTSFMTVTPNVSNPSSPIIQGPRSFFELTGPAAQNAPAPPTNIVMDFSNPLELNQNFANDIFLVRSANTSGSPSDGDFGNLGLAGIPVGQGSGYTIVQGVTVSVADASTGALQGQPGFKNATRLILNLPANLPADQYRVYIPNSVRQGNAIFDVYGNQLDLEFLGTPNATNTGYQDLMPNGSYRQGLTGDGVAGGAFMTGFTIAPNGNVIYARPGYQPDPNIPSTYPDGSLARPYPVLAPQAAPNALNSGTLNNGDPNGGLNSPVNYGTGFNPAYDRAGLGQFEPSAFYAASQLALRGPVVIIALPGVPQLDPNTGQTLTPTFVLQAPFGSNPTINDASASVPYNTMLTMDPGAVLKLENASLYVQNQGSSLQTLGGPNPSQQVIFTSYADASLAGTPTNGSGVPPQPGDWGGIVFRNYNEVGRNVAFPIDGVLTQGINGAPAVSGENDAMSIIDFTQIHYAGSAIPQTQGQRFDAITLFNSRPEIVNSVITQNSQAAISGDLNSFRVDDLYPRGLIVRTTTVYATSVVNGVTQYFQNSLNGIWVRPDQTGFAEQSTAIQYPANPSSLGGVTNYAFDSPLPYLLTAPILVGQELLENTGGQTQFVNNRLYIYPGMMVKSQFGAGIAVVNNAASIVIGDPTYMNEFDQNPNFNPNTPGFAANSTNNAPVLFTSLYDSTATTAYLNPQTQQSTTIVPAIDSTGNHGALQPTPGNVPAQARWGSVVIQMGAQATINNATFQYGGGRIQGPDFVLVNLSVLAFTIFDTPFNTPLSTTGNNALTQLGTHALVTNNNFFYNTGAAMQIEPNGLMAGDPTRPLLSGHPFFRGNVMQGNDMDGLQVITNTGQGEAFSNGNATGQIMSPIGNGNVNQTVSTVWDATDLTYILRGSIVIGGWYDNGVTSTQPVPSSTSYGAEPTPADTLTIQSALPGTLLADGTTIPKPGQSVIIKLWNDFTPWDAGNLGTYGSTGAVPGNGAAINAGAGFVLGVDDAVDPPGPSPFLDPGFGAQLRIIGIPGDQSTNQPRVPVIITSLRDGTVGTTVRGVKMYNIFEANPTGAAPTQSNPTALSTPAAGDGGYIYFGGSSMFTYNANDPRGGNLLDNVDIRYMTSVQFQGGGVVDVGGVVPSLANWRQIKTGYAGPLTQFNITPILPIFDSNIASMKDAGVFAHPDAANALISNLSVAPDGSVAASPPVRIKTPAVKGYGITLYMVNDTVSNSPVGVLVNSDTVNGLGQGDVGQSPEQVVLLHDTFYNDAIGYHSVAPTFNGNNDMSHVYSLVMNNIFSNISSNAVQIDGQAYNSQLQYNLFYQVGTAFANNSDTAVSNVSPFTGNPEFVNAAAGNFQLQPTSAAIDAARSEIGPTAIANAIFPAVTQVLNTTGGIRTDPNSLPSNEIPGASNPYGGIGTVTDPRDLVQLPGEVGSAPGTFAAGYVDQMIPALPGTAGSFSGPSANSDTNNWLPLNGVRDQLGNLRIDDSNVPNVGYGSRPFFDLGATEYIQTFPPHVTGVFATITDPNSPTGTSVVPLYKVGGNSGLTATPLSIEVTFDQQINPNTINPQSIQLEASGGQGFGGNNTLARFLNLAGKLSFNNVTDTLTIAIGSAGLSLGEDEYRLFVFGNGPSFLTNPQGTPLDGQNTPNQDPNGVTGPLPSGSGTPGTNFFDTFTIISTPSSIVPGTFQIAAVSDTNRRDGITYNNEPSFTGTITDVNPLIDPLGGQTVIIDLSPYGDGNFNNFLGAAVGITNANGTFTATYVNSGAIPNTPYSVGPDGIMGDPGTSPYGIARVRIIDASGNQSNLVTDPLQSYVNAGATAGYIVDTVPPTVATFTPQPNTVVAPNANGQIVFTFTTNKTIDPTSLSNGSVVVTRSGPDGQFGTGSVVLPIDTAYGTNGFIITPLKNGPLGPEQISFAVSSGITNGLYRVTLKGTGTTPIFDIAGNDLSGLNNGVPGSDYNAVFDVNSSTLANHLFVGAASYVTNPSATIGDRTNPYPTIQAAINAANFGDQVDVLPGVYTENVTMRSLVSLFSVDPSSTDKTIVAGNALQTVIRAPSLAAGSTAVHNVTVQATNLVAVSGSPTEIFGFTIASPLLGNPATGTIDSASIGVLTQNSSLLLASDYFIDSGFGVAVETTGADAPVPTIENTVIAGDVFGLLVNDTGSTTSLASPVNIINNDFVFNTVGILGLFSPSDPVMANVINNIFWNNHDQTASQNGLAMYATQGYKIAVLSNMFYGNGPGGANQSNATIGIGGGFDPAKLGPTPDALGNYVGQPSFVFPVDPRPGADGPATFFLDADFDITVNSAAIDTALNSSAPPTDFLGRGRVKIPGRGFPGTGPADVGAFEYQGTGGAALGGAFRVAATSLAQGTGTLARGLSITSTNAPTKITVDFSQNVDPTSVSPQDLVLSGNGLSITNPAHAVSLNWIDAHTVEFQLAGGFNVAGTVNASILGGSIRSTSGATLPAFNDSITLTPYAPPAVTVAPTAPATSSGVISATAVAPVALTPPPAAAPVVTPAPAAAPIAVTIAHAPHGPLHTAAKHRGQSQEHLAAERRRSLLSLGRRRK